jgi:hypothetical protein
LADKPECVKALLVAGADVNISASEASSMSTAPPGYVADFLHEYPDKLHAQVCMLLTLLKLQLKLIHCQWDNFRVDGRNVTVCSYYPSIFSGF